MINEPNKEIKMSIVVDAPLKKVFRAITDPKELTKWFPDLAVFEPKVGGRVQFTFYKGNSDKRDKDFYHEGQVLEFDPDKRISYTWSYKNIPGFPRTTVTWHLKDIGNNRTRVDLVHSGFVGTKNEMYDNHKEGWKHFLNNLVLHYEQSG